MHRNLFLWVDAEVWILLSGSGHELPDRRVELADEAVIAALQKRQ